MFRVERSQISNENTGRTFFCQDKLHWTMFKTYKVEYISKSPSFDLMCVRLMFGLLLLPTCTSLSLEKGPKWSAGILLVSSYLFQPFVSLCSRCWHPSVRTEKTQKAPASDRTSRQRDKLLCLLHPQLGAIGLTLTSNCGLRYFVHIQQEQQYSTYLADETDGQGHCIYRIPFGYSSNIPRSSPPKPTGSSFGHIF